VITFLPVKLKIHPHQVMENYVKLYRCYSKSVNLHRYYLFCIYLFFFLSSFMYLKDEGKERG